MKLNKSLLFEGLSEELVQKLLSRARPRSFAPGESLCRQDEDGRSLFVIQSGMVEVILQGATTALLVARLREGDVFGEMALLTGEPRSANVVASVSTQVLELEHSAFEELNREDPRILQNILCILIERQKLSDSQRLAAVERLPAEVLALVFGPDHKELVDGILGETLVASQRRPGVLDLTGSLEPGPLHVDASRDTVSSALSSVDRFLAKRHSAIVTCHPDQRDLPLLVTNADRIVLLLTEGEAREFLSRIPVGDPTPELLLIHEEVVPPGPQIPGLRPLRTISRSRDPSILPWIGRHLAGTKLGLALGAGGAKGAAHAGVLEVLEESGFVVDCIAGTSAGAVIGSLSASGLTAREVVAQAQHLMSPEIIGPFFRLVRERPSRAREIYHRALEDAASGLHIERLEKTTAVVTADLTTKKAHCLLDGPLGQALIAATSLPGITPPVEFRDRRLIDGVAVSPVPTRAVRDLGADLVIAVNLIHHETLASWPGPVPEGPAPSRSHAHADPLFETIEMLQLETSRRQAAEADVIVAPRFGPSTWRDIHLVELFRKAGREAMEAQIPRLRQLTAP